LLLAVDQVASVKRGNFESVTVGNGAVGQASTQYPQKMQRL